MDRPEGNIVTVVRIVNPIPDDIPAEAFEQFESEEDFINATVMNTLNEAFDYEIEIGEVPFAIVTGKLF